MLIDSAFTELCSADFSVCTPSPGGWDREGAFSAHALYHITEFGSFGVSQIIATESGTALSVRSETHAEPVERTAEEAEPLVNNTTP